MKERSIQTKHLRLSALEFGNINDTPVIALHGWLDNSASFIPISDYLDGNYIVAIDFPGHGKSDHRSGVNAYHFIDYAADIISAANSLGFETFSLFGHSLGAGVAALIAAVIPERVKKVALVEGLAPLTNSADKFMYQYRKHIDAVLKPPSSRRIYKNINEAAKARQNAGDLNFASARLIAERNLTKIDGSYVWRTDRCLHKPSPVYLVESHLKHYLQAIRCDTLLVRSSQGILKRWESLRGREPYLESLVVVDIDGGHHCHMDDPQSVAKHVAPFLSCS